MSWSSPSLGWSTAGSGEARANRHKQESDRRPPLNPRHDAMTERLTARADRRVLTPWRAVIGFGVVSLAADMVYEGARSVTGPLLASLGASALLVGLVTGAGEALALVLRLPFGTRADRSRGYWPMTIAGYALTAVCVP